MIASLFYKYMLTVNSPYVYLLLYSTGYVLQRYSLPNGDAALCRCLHGAVRLQSDCCHVCRQDRTCGPATGHVQDYAAVNEKAFHAYFQFLEMAVLNEKVAALQEQGSAVLLLVHFFLHGRGEPDDMPGFCKALQTAAGHQACGTFSCG